MLCISRRPGESIVVGNTETGQRDLVIHVQQIRDGKVRLAIEAHPIIEIWREEIWREIQARSGSNVRS